MAQSRLSGAAKVDQGVAAHLADLLRNLNRDLFDSYRPERHYMRGPGPKWHAKHARQAANEPVNFPHRTAEAV
jgi:hypothetical protein